MDLLYYLMVASFFTHELDAVKRREWRIIPGLNLLSDRASEQLFIWLHIPISALLLLGGDSDPWGAVRICLSVFAVVHVGLHWLYRNNPANEFNNLTSWTLILGTGVLGVVYLSVGCDLNDCLGGR
ncbi:MAG: hypothetical protein GY788_09835 [bacterium]|nr:hypothetical protein [bacterium]